jgi:hypothetical protein
LSYANGRFAVGHIRADVAPAPIVRTRRVAILGFSATVKDCPWRDPSWELWGMNGFWRAARPDFGIEADESRFTLWFDMHSREYTREYGARAGFGDQQEKWLQQEHPFPIYMLDDAPDFPSVRAFPIDDVIAHLGRDYFTSTVAYAIAYAATLPDVAEVGLWGIDLVHSTEYADQRPCAEYWIAKAEAAGIAVTIHERSALLKQRQRYGYAEPSPLVAELRAALNEQSEGLTKAIANWQAELARLTAQAHTDDGALQAVRGLLNRLDIWERGGRA